MKIRRTVKQYFYDRELWPKPVDAGNVEIIDEGRMERILRCTKWLFEDCREVDPATKTEHNPTGSYRPPGTVVGWRTLKETGKLETFYADYELIEA